MQSDEAIYHRDQLRAARANAARDAEGFPELLFAIERPGLALTRKVGTLADYKKRISDVAADSPLAEDIPTKFRGWHTPFHKLYEQVREARNDALHQGAFARHLTTHAVQVALILEDALMKNAATVAEF